MLTRCWRPARPRRKGTNGRFRSRSSTTPAFPLLLERLEGAGATTPEVALGKARTAALTKQPTRLWEDRVKERPAFINYPAGLAIWGGVPIIYQNECVGAIGVSGVQSQDDEKVANAGVAVLT
jgi:glc operon protein GlcG